MINFYRLLAFNTFYIYLELFKRESRRKEIYANINFYNDNRVALDDL